MEVLQELLHFLGPVATEYLGEGPAWALRLWAIMGLLRNIMKPLMSLVRTYVSWTPKLSDDKALAKVEQSKIYKMVIYVIDWFASIKFPGRS